MSSLLKQIKLIGMLVCTLMFIIGCEKENILPISKQNAITAATASYLTDATTGTFSTNTIAVITGTDITFTYTGTAATAVDVTKMRIYVTIPNNAKLTSPLSGLKDLTNPLSISVVAQDGSIKDYTLKVVKLL